jgi:hypothetical protein
VVYTSQTLYIQDCELQLGVISLRAVKKAIIFVFILTVVGSQSLFALHTRTPYKSSASRRPARLRRTPAKRAAIRRAAIRRVYWNPVLRGSRESLLRQNEEINRLQLPRIANDDELLQLEQRQELVRIEDRRDLVVSSNIEDIRRYCRPWTLQFVNDLAEAHYAKFKRPLELTSAVRTVEQQAKLRRTNRNAAPIEGDTASSHLAGLTIDIGKKGMSRVERKWFDQYLVEMQNNHIIEAAEERRQACYHIMVGETYPQWRDERSGLATASKERFRETAVGAKN